jgi:hypothetical protein
VVAVRVWTYKKPENKTLPPPTSIPQATPTCHPWEDNFYNKQMSIVMQYYNDWEQKSGKKKAIKKTLDWINGKLPSEAPVPEGMVKAYMGGINGTSIMINFNDGTSIGFDTEPLEDMP